MNINLPKYRNWAANKGVQVFSPPYLPDGLIKAALILILLHTVLVLLSQNLQYWYDFELAENSIPFIQNLVQTHPLAWLGTGFAFLSLAWLILQVLNRSLALIVWTGLAFMHLSQIFILLGELTGLISAENPGDWSMLQPLLSGLAVGLLLSTILLHPAKAARPTKTVTIKEEKRAVRPWFLNWKIGMAAILLVAIAVSALVAFMSPKGGWKPVALETSPGPRCCAAIAYDTHRSRAVLFGGATTWMGATNDNTDDTWEWSAGKWTKIDTIDKPPSREYAVMAFDPRRGVMVLFGGMNKEIFLNDTWEYDGTNWKNVTYYTPGLEPAPAARINHQLIFDPSRQKVVLLGGYGGKDANKQDVYTSDAWEWDGQSWQEILPPVEQPVVTSASIALDEANGRLVTMNYNHLLLWDQNRWEGFDTSNPPPARKNAGIAPLPGGGVVLFGGYVQDVRSDDTWLLNGESWKQYKSYLHPSTRAHMMMFYDPNMGRVYVYGGIGGSYPYLSDMWEFRVP